MVVVHPEDMYDRPRTLGELSRNRDAKLATLIRLRGWIAVGCVVLIFGFAAFVAQARPGKSTSVATGNDPQRTGPKVRFAQAPLNSVPSSAATPGVAPPPQPPGPATPAPAPAPAPVVSGGS